MRRRQTENPGLFAHSKDRARVIPALAAGDLFGVFFFIVVMVLSLLGKIKESKKTGGEWDAPPPLPPIVPDDVAKKVRRIYFGDEEPPIRTAKPARPEELRSAEASPDDTLAPAPRAPRPVRAYPPPRTQSPPATQRPVAIPPPRRVPPVGQRTVVVKKVVRVQPPVPADEDTGPRVVPPLPKLTPPVVRATVPPLSKPAVPKAFRTPEPESIIKAAFASDEAVKPIANPWRFKDKTDLRRAIVLAEILGPPLALRE